MNPVTHESLKLDGYWKISWFGKLVQHVQSHNSLSWIKVYLTELDASNLKVLSTKITLVIPIQEIVRLHQYSLVNNGQPIAHPNGHFLNDILIETEINFDKDNLLIFDRYFKHNNQLVIKESQQSDLTNENNGLLLDVYDDHNSLKYVIPCIEIFKFFYASSSVLVINSLLSGLSLLKQAISRLNLSARAYHHILKLARTIADLANSEHILPTHIAETI